MVDWSSWVHWNTETALLYTIISVSIWIIIEISKTDQTLKKIKHPKLLGIAASLISCFDLGLYAIIPMFNFLLISYVLEYWLFRLNNKNNKKNIIKENTQENNIIKEQV